MKDTIKGFKLFENAIEELNNSFQGKPPTTKEGKKMLKAMNKIIAEKVKEAREDEAQVWKMARIKDRLNESEADFAVSKLRTATEKQNLKIVKARVRFETAKEIIILLKDNKCCPPHALVFLEKIYLKGDKMDCEKKKLKMDNDFGCPLCGGNMTDHEGHYVCGCGFID